MKKLLLFLIIAITCITISKAQIYDGITQPTKYRILVPVSTSLDKKHNVSSAPFVGYKINIAKWLSLTPVAQFNLNKETFLPQIWANFNVKETFYFLSRSIYNVKTKKYSNTISATAKLPYGFMIDATWDNFYSDSKFTTNDRLQFVAGISFWNIVCNAGYSVKGNSGIIANFRYKITTYNWLQLKYDKGMNSITLQTFLQFN